MLNVECFSGWLLLLVISQVELLMTLEMLSRIITVIRILVFGRTWVWSKFIVNESLEKF